MIYTIAHAVVIYGDSTAYVQKLTQVRYCSICLCESLYTKRAHILSCLKWRQLTLPPVFLDVGSVEADTIHNIMPGSMKLEICKI